MAEYALRIYNRTGVLQAILVGNTQLRDGGGFRTLAYRKEVNGVGLLTFVLDADHPLLDDLDRDWQVEVWRWDNAAGIDKACDFYGFYIDDEASADDEGNSTSTVYCIGQMDLLARAIVAYKADTANRSLFTSAKAETIAKTLVTRNATSSGTTGDGRVRNVDTWGSLISVQADGATGSTIDFACAYQNLLEALQDVARIGGGDFDLVKTGAQAWEFRWYNGQLGTDRSASVIFSQGRGNMRNPRRVRNRFGEYTVAVVGGQGTEASRDVVVRTGTNYDATYNSREQFVPATQYSTTDGLNGEGDRKLAEVQARDNITFQVNETPSTRYGLHYSLGDLVTASYRDTAQTKQIVAVTVSYVDGGDKNEEVGIEVANV